MISFIYMDSEIIVKKNEEKVIPFVWIGEGEDQKDITIRLSEEGASVHVVGICVGLKTDRLFFNTSVIHDAPKTRSLTSIRGVFSDTSRFSNNGMVSIKNGAKGADGYFASKILLFNSARGRSVPSLEIDENDLKAGHASTVGRPDPMQLYFLQSRGISEKEAIKLLIGGFFEQTILYLPIDKQKVTRQKILKTITAIRL